MGDWLLLVAAAFLVAHLVTDLRTAVCSVRHPRDTLWTALTLGALGGHLVMDFIGG